MPIAAIARRLAAAGATLLLAAGPAAAQSHDGAWAGVITRPDGGQLHLVLHVASKDGDTEATLESVDQNDAMIPATAYKGEGNKASILFLNIGLEIEGEFAADGQTFTGKMTQGLPIPLTLKRVAEKP